MIVKMRSITMKKQPQDLKIQKPLSLYPMKFDETVDILLATKPKRHEAKNRLKEKYVSGEVKTT
jgi:hypothetical protein